MSNNFLALAIDALTMVDTIARIGYAWRGDSGGKHRVGLGLGPQGWLRQLSATTRSALLEPHGSD